MATVCNCHNIPFPDCPNRGGSMTDTKFSYDAKCEELAEYFLPDTGDGKVQELAQVIQDAVEDFLREPEE